MAHNNNRWFTLSATTMLLVSVILPVSTAAAKSKSVKPTQAVLKASAKKTRANAKGLASKYKLAYGAQRGFDKKGRVWIYAKTSSKTLKSSLKVAANYWNSRLGKKEFNIGTKSHHTVTFTATNQKNGNSDAWWTPSLKSLKVQLSYYSKSHKDVQSGMTSYVNSYYQNQVAVKTTNYLANRGIATTDPKYSQEFYSYAVKHQGTEQKNAKKAVKNINQSVATQGVMYEYASTLAHEMGHIIGLNHSPNKLDLMYYQSGNKNIYNYFDVKRGLRGYNPVTATDKARAQLAIKVWQAKH
ncbi:matrixin family metalloprotease [Levilactobacillus bambusae]|uniref:Peptidase M10 metallopeptidase domain-containing protein n=1 Tax=Levilactobacillus bambusae TaxID=2024736 RepID=A0A2V1MZF9_9LACO|nr:matrixin family metalloprotease [Levilactobacillus bambusae]PWG00153.1 hypothetical protein DCM90_04255 [Levilactobacillus bambusae]